MIKRIIAPTKAMERFRRRAHGWAPAEAADMLAAARLDRQVSFTHTLSDYHKPFAPQESEARLILGYVTLRALCEGILKLFFAVWWEDYRKDAAAAKDKKGTVKTPGAVSFDRLIALYAMKVDSRHKLFLRRIQQRRNAIHHFNDSKIGSQDELIADIAQFLDFLLAVNSRLPYPDEVYDPANAQAGSDLFERPSRVVCFELQ
jgi:hypothetical protein